MLQPSTAWLCERMTWLNLIGVPCLNMENLVSTMQALSVKSTASLPTLSPGRLRKRYTTEKKAALPFGIDVRRLSDYEPVSLRTRGTLGGFRSLSNLGGTENNDYSLENEMPREKECCLTTLTKKIGLGVYLHPRRSPSPSRASDGKRDWELDGDERETWFMFYPPPPSPSLAMESARWESASSDPDSRPQSPSEQEFQMEQQGSDESLHEANSPRDSLYPSTQSGALTPEIVITMMDAQDAAMNFSVENLAQQYGDILPPGPDLGPFSRQESTLPTEPQLQLEFGAPVASTPPRTIRKVKAQHSLRNVVDLRSQRPISSIPSLSSSFQATSSSIETTTVTFRKAILKRERLSHKSRTPSPPPRDSSLSFSSSSSYSYAPGHGPRRTHGRKRSPTTQSNTLDEFEFHGAINDGTELNNEVSSDPFDHHLDLITADGDDSALFPRPLALRRPGPKKTSPPPDPVHWEIPPVPHVPSILVIKPMEKETMGDSTSGFRQSVPQRGGDGGGVTKGDIDMIMAGMWSMEGGWI